MLLWHISYGKSITTLSKETPRGAACSVAAKVGNCDLENTVRFLLLEMFSKSPPFSDLRSRRRPIRGTGQSESQRCEQDRNQLMKFIHTSHL